MPVFKITREYVVDAPCRCAATVMTEAEPLEYLERSSITEVKATPQKKRNGFVSTLTSQLLGTKN